MKTEDTTYEGSRAHPPASFGERRAAAQSRNAAASILAPETLLPSQLPRAGDELAMRAGVKGLMLAILEDAVYCLTDVSSACAKRRMEARKAEGWIREPGDDWLFSFDSICRVLDLEPEDLRFRLLSVPPEEVVPHKGRRLRSHRVERGKRKRRGRGSDELHADESGGPDGDEDLGVFLRVASAG